MDLGEDPEPDPVFPCVRQGIEFIAHDDSNGELRITGDDDAGLLLWGAQWLDEHRDWIITAMRFQHPAVPGGSGITATVIIGLTMPGTLPPGDLSLKPRLGPWAHGVPPMDWLWPGCVALMLAGVARCGHAGCRGLRCG